MLRVSCVYNIYVASGESFESLAEKVAKAISLKKVAQRAGVEWYKSNYNDYLSLVINVPLGQLISFWTEFSGMPVKPKDFTAVTISKEHTEETDAIREALKNELVTMGFCVVND
jgi:hypothetical protein